MIGGDRFDGTGSNEAGLGGARTETGDRINEERERRESEKIARRGSEEGEREDEEWSHRALTTAVRIGRLSYRLGSVLARVVAVGLRILVTILRDDERQRSARRWLLLSGKRWTVVAPLVLVFFLGSLALGATHVIGVQESDFVTTMFSTIIAGLFSFVPVMISVNNLTLSRLFGSPDHLRERIEAVDAFRRDVEAMAPEVAVVGTDPADFLAALMAATLDRCDTVDAALESAARDDGAVEPIRDDIDTADANTATESHAAVDTFIERIRAEATAVVETVDGANPPVFSLLVPLMDVDCSVGTNEARRLRTVHSDLPQAVRDRLAEVGDVLVDIDVTRQYFKALYLQQELATLSRYVAYTGISAYLTSTLVIMIYASGYPPVDSEGALLLLVTLSLTVAFCPFAILFAYVIRIATVIQRTAAPGTFTPRGGRLGDGHRED